MSDELFEVAFSGQICDGAEPGEVKAKVSKMFNADDAKLAQLFSGRRVVIKKNIDRATADKYQTALNKAGAECEICLMGETPVAQSAPLAAAAPAPAAPAAIKPASAAASAVEIETGDYGEVAPPPAIDPLGITGDQIEDLDVSIAPVGSELQNDYEEIAEPEFDLNGLEVAPVGSDLDSAPKKPAPPPPDTSGITMADE